MNVSTLLLRLVAAILILGVGQRCVLAQSDKYPVKPVRIIVPLSPGGATDLNARIIADELSRRLKEQFVVDNRPGAGGTIGTELAARSSPDGYTLLGVSTTNMVISNQLYKVRYNTLRDFVPIALTTRAPNLIVVHPSLPAKSVSDLVSLAKNRPGELFYSSSGSGTNVHLAMEMFKTATGTNIVHVPHKGGDASVVSLLTGQTQVAIQVVARLVSLVETGKLRAIAVTSSKRSRLLPKVPTVMESGVPGYEVWLWGGMVAPAGTPDAIVQKLSTEIARMLESPAIRERLALDGSEVWPLGPKEFAAFAKAEYEKWGKAFRDSGARID